MQIKGNSIIMPGNKYKSIIIIIIFKYNVFFDQYRPEINIRASLYCLNRMSFLIGHTKVFGLSILLKTILTQLYDDTSDIHITPVFCVEIK